MTELNFNSWIWLWDGYLSVSSTEIRTFRWKSNVNDWAAVRELPNLGNLKQEKKKKIFLSISSTKDTYAAYIIA